MKDIRKCLILIILPTLICHSLFAQNLSDSSWKKAHKNVLRYNLSGSLLFGFDKYILLGYERAIKPHQTISLNVGVVGLPKFISVSTDSIQFSKDTKNNGFNFSLDYRFYLKKENKFLAPRGVYIGPFYAYNRFNRDNEWKVIRSSGNNNTVTTSTKFDIHTIGAELGYQFVFWKRLAVDLILIGPGLSSYKLKSKVGGTLTAEQQQKLFDAVQQLFQQKIPGMDLVFDDQEINGNGVISKWSFGYRYMINIGFNF